MQIKVIGSHCCPDTLYALNQLAAAGAEIDFVDILASHADLKQYLALRDSDPLYAEIRGTERRKPLWRFSRTKTETSKRRKTDMEIRCAKNQDVDAIAHLEAVCFPQAEAATRESIEERVKAYPNHFFLMWDGDQLVSFVNGLVTDQPDLTDEMYEKADMHQEDGAWQMIFGVDTDPARRKQGLAGTVLEHFIDAARKEGRKGVVLTCKDRLVHYYAKFGFVDEGISDSTHGDVVWHQMRLTFNRK